MWAITGILILSGGIIYLEVPKLLKQKMYKELFAFSFLLTIGMILSILKSLNIPIPNPLEILTFIYKPLSELIFGLFK